MPFFRRNPLDEWETWGIDRALLYVGHGFDDLARSLERQRILDRLDETDPDFAAELRERWQSEAVDEAFEDARRQTGDPLLGDPE